MLIACRLRERGSVTISTIVREAFELGTDDLLEIRLDGITTTVKIRSRNRVTIPSQLREELSLEEGDLVEMDVRLPG